MQKILRIDPKDNLIVALRDLAQGDIIENDGQRIQLVTDVPAKHKFTREPVPVGGIVTLYGVPVGKAVALSTLLAVVTMPIVVSAVMMVLGK